MRKKKVHVSYTWYKFLVYLYLVAKRVVETIVSYRSEGSQLLHSCICEHGVLYSLEKSAIIAFFKE